MLSADCDRIAHLRLHGVGDGARQRFAETLARIETLHPPDLPPGAILLIRHLDVRWSTADTPAIRGDLLRREVADLVPHAARPALGPVPADARAVLFASRSELLACLALDALRGLDGWWWRLLDPPQIPARFATAWEAAPELLPQTIAWLAERSALVPVLVRLEPGRARTLTHALIHRLGLRELVATFAALPDHPITPPEARPRPPWRAWAPELDDNDLPPPVQLFAALATTLHRAEAHARSPGFAAVVHAWAVALTPAPPVDPPAATRDRTPDLPPTSRSASASQPSSPPSSSPVPSTMSHRADAPSPEPHPQSHTTARLPGPTLMKPELDTQAHAQSPPPHHAITPQLAPPRHTDELTATLATTASPLPATLKPPAPLQPSRPHEPLAPHSTVLTFPLDLPSSLRTELGGSFYLINVALALDLYGDFTRPLHRGLDLSPWDFLAELTARLLPNPTPPDPLWTLLATLAGRSPLAITTTPSLNTPADLAPPGPANFAALEQQVRDLLGRTLDLSPAIWLRQPASIFIGEARLDVRYALADHPVELRIAGLDRDPGFVPAAGRDIRFWYDP